MSTYGLPSGTYSEGAQDELQDQAMALEIEATYHEPNSEYTFCRDSARSSSHKTSLPSFIDDNTNAAFQPSPQGANAVHTGANVYGHATSEVYNIDPYDATVQITPPAAAHALDPTAMPPALDFNGYILYAAGRPVPKELMRVPTGTSIAEPGSIMDEESGRMYHNHPTGRYFLPNDPAEQDRLDLQHKMVTLLLDRQLHHAPVRSPRNVLDVATGTGIWAINFAKLHPNAKVVGTDLSLIQPENTPSNVSFIKEDSEKDEWIFPEPFDFIFLRLVVTAFDDHRTVIKKAFDNLNPGGWIEFNDVSFQLLCTDGTANGTNIQRWSELTMQAADAVGRDFRVVEKYKQWLLDAGFVDVVEEKIPLPMNPWPTDLKFMDIGRWEMLNGEKAVRGISWKLFRNLGMAPDEIENLVELVQTDFRDLSIHGFYPFYVVYGRKPYPGEAA